MNIIYFHKDIKSFLDSLEKTVRAKVNGMIVLLSAEEYHLSMPYSKRIEKDIYELRIKSLQNIRIFYTFFRNQIVLLHVINKKSQRLEKNDLSIIRQRLLTLHN